MAPDYRHAVDFDLVILGSGFSGSLVALIGRRLGLRVLLIERRRHPRFVIGESTSPLTNLLWEELAAEYELTELIPFAAYGTWKASHPEIGVGLKRGFTFYAHSAAAGAAGGRNPDPDPGLLVAASPNDAVADTHWYRPDFDAHLVRVAQRHGAEYLDETAVETVSRQAGSIRVEARRNGTLRSVTTRLVVDASGTRGALHQLLGLREGRPLPEMPRAASLFAHFSGVGRMSDQRPSAGAPYPPDASALHHLFPGGWMWVLPFDNGITSAGLCLTAGAASGLRLDRPAQAWSELLSRHPEVGQQFADAEPTTPFYVIPELRWRGTPGPPGTVMLPSALGFVDPLFSTGFPLTLLGIQRLGRLLPSLLSQPETALGLAAYYRACRQELAASERLVAASYACFGRFSEFAALSMLYFVAASFSESARRMGRPGLAPGFLMCRNRAFRSVFDATCAQSLAGDAVSLNAVGRLLEPWNVAGLCDPARRNWYPADPADLVRNAAKVRSTPAEVTSMLAGLGLGVDALPNL